MTVNLKKVLPNSNVVEGMTYLMVYNTGRCVVNSYDRYEGRLLANLTSLGDKIVELYEIETGGLPIDELPLRFDGELR